MKNNENLKLIIGFNGILKDINPEDTIIQMVN